MALVEYSSRDLVGHKPIEVAILDASGNQVVPLSVGAGDASAANQATQITAEQAIQATAGATTGAAVTTDTNGTLQQYLRGIVKLLIGFITVKIDQTTPGTTNGVVVNANALVAAPITGQLVIAVTGTRIQLTAGALTNGVIVTAKSTNVAPMTVGTVAVTNTVSGAGNGYILEPGASVSFAVSNTNALYVNGTAGDICSWAGS